MSFNSDVGFPVLFVVDLADVAFLAMLVAAKLAAAVGFTASILFLTTTISSAFSTYAGDLVARVLSDGQGETAHEVPTLVVVLGFVFAMCLAAVIQVSLPDLTEVSGVSGRKWALVVERPATVRHHLDDTSLCTDWAKV